MLDLECFFSVSEKKKEGPGERHGWCFGEFRAIFWGFLEFLELRIIKFTCVGS